MKKTVLILGISSFVGSNLALALKDDYRVIGTYHRTPVNFPGINCYQCDILKKEHVTNLTAFIKPDFTIYAVGMSSLAECMLRPKLADAYNSMGAINACIASERYGSRFIYLSSAYVFAGDGTVCRESDTPFPGTVYGNTLSSTEFYVQRSCLNYLMLRCCPLYGRSYGAHHPNWFEVMQAGFAQNQPLHADDSVFTGHLDVTVMARILKQLMQENVSNRLFHVSSRDLASRFELALKMARIFKLDENLVQRYTVKFPLDENGMKAAAGYLNAGWTFALDTSNVEEFMGLQLPTIEESLSLTLNRMKSPLAG